MFRSDVPLISVITATRNAVDALPITVASLKAQKFPGFEWLVADGGSTDGTVELLRDNADLISWQVSGPDKGIYDAWNKACRHARGEWLIFLGAGDELAAADTLEDCAAQLLAADPSSTLMYGRQLLLSPQTRSLIEAWGLPWQEIYNRWEIGRPALPPHGATFHRKALFAAAEPFDLRFPIASDAHFLLRQVTQAAPVFMSRDVTRSPLGGVSLRLDTARQVGREISAINRELGLRPPLLHRLGDRLRLAVTFVVSALPPSIAHRIADLARRLTGKASRWTMR